MIWSVVMNRDTLGQDINHYTNTDRLLVDYLKEMIYKSKSIDIIVSFIQVSGIRLLEKEFKYIKDNKIPIRIITGTYMGITDPAAIYMLKDILNGHGETKFYADNKRSFHPKSYFFNLEDEAYVYVGSSNISKSALVDGVEWNYRVVRSRDHEAYSGYLDEFNMIFEKYSYDVTDEVLAHYSKIRRKPQIPNYDDELLKHVSLKNDSDRVLEAPEALYADMIKPFTSPNNAQIEALYALKRIRETGADKSLVVAATGVGKTYLAAFDTLAYERVLFIAHREEILKQAYSTFVSVRGLKDLGYYNGFDKNEEAFVVFASVQTLSKQAHLDRFDPEFFDYIVVDEFHHSATNTYQKIMDYFKPKFLLGLTATPDRRDNKDIYAFCDYNVAYEVDLFDAINKGYLCPFHYHAVYDGTVNYDKISYINGKYVEKELSKSLSTDLRNKLIYKHYKRFGSKQAIGFCSSIIHADHMATWFTENGIPALAVHSQSNNRQEAVNQLINDQVKILFVVDIFNEGVDIKSIDLIMFLRPTESPIVFLQQLGRGLRLDTNKTHLTVLDFVGNYKKVNTIPILLTGKNYVKDKNKIDIKEILNPNNYPDGCIVNFDMAVIDIIEKFNKARRKIQESIVEEYKRLKDDLGKIPSRTEFFKYMDDDLYLEMKKKAKINVFKDYIGFLKEQESDDCFDLKDPYALSFIKMIENTSMNKLYKLPILKAFYNNGDIKMTLTDEDISNSFRKFYSNGQNALDMFKDKATRDFKHWDDKDFVDLAFKNPIHYLIKSEGEYFELKDRQFSLNKRLKNYIHNETFMMHFKDVIEYKRLRFLKDNLLKKEEEIKKWVEGGH